MASGQMGTELKFFFHGQMADNSGFFMMEILFNLQAKSLTCTLKSTRPDMDGSFQQYLNAILTSYTIWYNIIYDQ
jgi:hypothetical protein